MQAQDQLVPTDLIGMCLAEMVAIPTRKDNEIHVSEINVKGFLGKGCM